MDVGFLVQLLLVSSTGLLLLALRESAAMGIMLALHLGAVMAFFITLPYGKFVHAIYRFTRWSVIMWSGADPCPNWARNNALEP